ncbi:MAG: hypothetical protein ABWW66_00340 [Archaeoglobaceae archaeon]
MIIALANLHSNLLALAEILSYAERMKEEGTSVEAVYVISPFGLMPYPREVYELLHEKPEFIRVVAGKYDRLLAKWSELSEEEKESYGVVAEVLDVYWDMLGHEGRKWVRNMEESFLTERFGDNEFYFVYGLLEAPDEMPLENEPPSYYEAKFAELRKYEVIVVAGRKQYVVPTRIGKFVCPGVAGLGRTADFAVIDTKGLAVSFDSVEYKVSEVEDAIEQLDVSAKAKEFLKDALYREVF